MISLPIPIAHIYLMLCLLHSSKMIIKVSVCDNFIFSRQNNYNEIECVSYSCYDLIFQNNRLVWNIENSPNYEDKSLICKPKHYLQIEFPILWQLKSCSLWPCLKILLCLSNKIVPYNPNTANSHEPLYTKIQLLLSFIIQPYLHFFLSFVQ